MGARCGGGGTVSSRRRVGLEIKSAVTHYQFERVKRKPHRNSPKYQIPTLPTNWGDMEA